MIFALLMCVMTHVCALAAWSDDLPTIPSLSYVLSGYNMLKASPGADVDSLASADVIFASTYAQRNNYTERGVRYKVPDGFTVLADDSCQWENTILSSVDSAAELQQWMFRAAGEASLVGTAAFAVSTLFTSMFSSSTTHNYASWAARCTTFRVTSSIYDSTLDDRFVDSVVRLDTTSDAAMLAFANKYGTDVITSATFGALTLWQRQLVQNVYSNLTALQIGAAIRADFFKNKLSVAAEGSAELLELLNANSVSEIATSVDRPCAPPPSASPLSTPNPTSTWQPLLRIDSDDCAPVMLEPRLTQPITDLFTTEFFPPSIFPGLDINQKRVDLTIFLTLRYCALLGPEALSKCAALHPLAGAVTYFATTCPNGWIEHRDSLGRIVLAVNHSSNMGVIQGPSMEDNTDRTHSHALSGTASAGTKQSALYAGLGLEVYDATSVSFTMTGVVHNATSAGLPFIHLKACEFVGATANSLLDLHLPYQSALLFGSLNRCPKGSWTPFRPQWSNRAIIPAKGEGDVVYPLSSASGWQPVNRSLSHTHAVAMRSKPQSTQVPYGHGESPFAIDPEWRTFEATASGEWNVSHTTLLGCFNDDKSDIRTKDAPAGMLIFTVGTACPEGWRSPTTWTPDMFGRYVVSPLRSSSIGLLFPPDVPNVPNNDQSYANGHQHTFQGTGTFPTKHCHRSTADHHCCGYNVGDCSPWSFEVQALRNTSDQVPFVHMIICEPKPLTT